MRRDRRSGRELDGASDPDRAKDLDLLLAELCAQWGICTALSGEALLQSHPQITSLQFARAVLAADGMDPDREPSWLRRVKRRCEQRWRSTTF